jgi:hypothetical protein
VDDADIVPVTLPEVGVSLKQSADYQLLADALSRSPTRSTRKMVASFGLDSDTIPLVKAAQASSGDCPHDASATAVIRLPW